MAKKNIKSLVNFLIEEEDNQARDLARKNLKYRVERLPEQDLYELERDFNRFLVKFSEKIKV